MLPLNDTFDAGATAYDSAVLCGAYVRNFFHTSDAVYGSGGSGYTTTWRKEGRGYNGHWAGPSFGPFVNTTSLVLGTNVGTTACTGWSLRDVYSSEVDVSATFKWRHSGAATLQYCFRTELALVARASGGSLTDGGTTTAYLSGGDCYIFHAVSKGDSAPSDFGRGVKFQFLRVVAGVVTRIAESPTGAPAAGTESNWLTWYALNAPRRLRFTVHTTGGTVQLRGYHTPAGGPEVLVLSFDDSSGSRITAAGRHGFFTPNENLTVNPITTVATALAVHVLSFQIATFAGVVQSYDDWSRFNLANADTVVPSFTAGSYPGFSPVLDPRDLTCGWQGDLHGVPGYVGRIGRSSDRLVFNSSATDKTGFYISQRLSDDIREQDRTVDFEFQNAAPSVANLVRGIGIALRANAPSQANS